MGEREIEVKDPAARTKKYVRYREGTELYSIGITKFQEMAHEAKEVYENGKLALVNCNKIEKYLEQFAVEKKKKK